MKFHFQLDRKIGYNVEDAVWYNIHSLLEWKSDHRVSTCLCGSGCLVNETHGMGLHSLSKGNGACFQMGSSSDIVDAVSRYNHPSLFISRLFIPWRTLFFSETPFFVTYNSSRRSKLAVHFITTGVWNVQETIEGGNGSASRKEWLGNDSNWIPSVGGRFKAHLTSIDWGTQAASKSVGAALSRRTHSAHTHQNAIRRNNR